VRHPLRPGLIVPTLLAVTSFGPACSGDKSPTPTGETGLVTESAGATDEPATTAAATTTAPTTADETTAPTTTTVPDTTDTGDTTTGELPDCEQYGGDMAACQMAPGCYWEPDLMSCIIDCMPLTTEAACNAAMICFWSDGVCYPPI
jgi:hypothetical protein